MTDTQPPITLTRRRKLAFAAVAAVLALTVGFGTLLAVDVYLHGKYQRSAGFNVWGYRGPVAGRKKAGEYRVAMLGGSSAFGYGVNWDEAIPAQLEQRLRKLHGGQRFTLLNLGYNNEGAYSFKFTLDDYLSLDYDLAILYEGYNDMMGDPRAPNLSVFRHDSPVFRLTGYLPIFPIIFKEKAAAMKSGDIGTLYGHEGKTTFHASLATKTAAEVIAATAEIGQSLEAQLGRVTAETPRVIVDAAGTGCKYPWQEYCRSMSDAVEYALAHNRQVMVVTQPYEVGAYLRARHMEQQGEVAKMLERKYGADPRVRYVNLGDSLDLANPALSFDHMHLTVAGNAIVSDGLVAPVTEMAARRQGAQR